MAVTSVPIRTNPDLRPSRLVRSLPDYVFRSAVTILRSFATYKPLRLFAGVGLLLIAAGAALGLRYLYLVQTGEGAGHVQSVILGALLIGMGVLTGLIGIVADLIAVNRRLLEKLLDLQQAAPRASRPARRAGAPAASHRPPSAAVAPRPGAADARADSAPLPADPGDDRRRQRLSQIHHPQSARAPAGHQLHDHAPPPGLAHRRARGPRGRLRRGPPEPAAGGRGPERARQRPVARGGRRGRSGRPRRAASRSRSRSPTSTSSSPSGTAPSWWSAARCWSTCRTRRGRSGRWPASPGRI